MVHPPEHTLELFVLGSASVRRERSRIAAHLEACDACRERAEEISALYREAESVFSSENLQRMVDPDALIRPSRDPVLYEQPGGPMVPPQPRTLARELRDIIRQNPIATGLGGLAFVGACAVAAMTLLRTTPADSNPALCQYDVVDSFLEVYNKNEEKLWHKGIWDASRSRDLAVDRGLHATRIMDLDRDGTNEVVTVALVKDGDARPRSDILTIFRADRSVRLAKALGVPSRYGRREYDDRFGAIALLPLDSPDGSPGLLVTMPHSRSPNLIVRLNAAGERIGEYWHYGHIGSLQPVRLDDGPPELLAAAGINDAADTAGGSFGMIIILDPREILGRTQSNATPEFGLEPSAAELYYVRLPLTDMEIATGYRGGAHQLTVLGEPTLSFDYAQQALGIGFNYEFDGDMAVRTVRINTGAEVSHKRLKEEGKISSELTLAYAENLKRGVRYWDGSAWVGYPTRILRSSGGSAGRPLP